jgi:hypothetical protein
MGSSLPSTTPTSEIPAFGGLDFASELHQGIIAVAVAHPNDREKITANRQDRDDDGRTTPGTNTFAALAG